MPLHHHLFTTTSHFMGKHNASSPTSPPHASLTLRENIMPLTLLENIIIPLTLQEKQCLFTTTCLSHFTGKNNTSSPPPLTLQENIMPLHHHLFTTTYLSLLQENKIPLTFYRKKHNASSPPLTLWENIMPLHHHLSLYGKT